MIDIVFEASIAEVLDDHFKDQRLKDALFGQGIIGAWAGPHDKGTATIKLMHYQGDLEGGGPIWGYVHGGMGMISFAIADAAQEAGARSPPASPSRRSSPRRASVLEDGTLIHATTVVCNADPKVALRLLGDHAPAELRARLEDWQLRSPVVKFNAALNRLPNWTAAPGQDFPARGTVDVTTGLDAAQEAFTAAPPERPPSASARSTSRPCTTPAPPPPATTCSPSSASTRPTTSTGTTAATRSQAVHRPDRQLRPRLRGHARALRGARPAGHRGSASASPAATSSRARTMPDQMWEHRLDAAHAAQGRLPVRRRHPPGGQRHRAQRPQRGDGGAGGRARSASTVA